MSQTTWTSLTANDIGTQTSSLQKDQSQPREFAGLQIQRAGVKRSTDYHSRFIMKIGSNVLTSTTDRNCEARKSSSTGPRSSQQGSRLRRGKVKNFKRRERWCWGYVMRPIKYADHANLCQIKKNLKKETTYQ
jgi:hypothetical protein